MILDRKTTTRLSLDVSNLYHDFAAFLLICVVHKFRQDCVFLKEKSFKLFLCFFKGKELQTVLIFQIQK